MKEAYKKIVFLLIGYEAHILIKRKKPKIIAITGNVGKTSTKDAIYSVIKQRVHARKSEKNYNTDIGVALTVLGIQNAGSNPVYWLWNMVEGFVIALFSRTYPEWLVIETGVDRPGDMSRLARWIKPDIVVLTRFPEVPVHVEYFKSPEQVIEEKMELVHALKDDGIVVFNSDDERIVTALEEISAKKIGFSHESISQYSAGKNTITYEQGMPIGTSFTVNHGNETAKIFVPGALGAQYTYSHTAAIAVGSLLGVSLTEGAEALRAHVPAPGRMRIVPGIKDTILLDDTYNAAPAAMEQAIVTLTEVHAKRKIAVLGDMLELGRYSVREHEKVGEFVASRVDLLVTVGVRARAIADSAIAKGLHEKRIFQFEDAYKAGKELEAIIMAGDVILAKGSQGVRMERVVEELMAHPEHAGELLVRQDEMWQRR